MLLQSSLLENRDQMDREEALFVCTLSATNGFIGDNVGRMIDFNLCASSEKFVQI